MHKVLLLGAGKIGRMIAHMLHGSGDYEVTVGDAHVAALEKLAARVPVAQRQIDATNLVGLKEAMRGQDVVLSALSYHHNPAVAEAALASGCSYFDLPRTWKPPVASARSPSKLGRARFSCPNAAWRRALFRSSPNT